MRRAGDGGARVRIWPTVDGGDINIGGFSSYRKEVAPFVCCNSKIDCSQLYLHLTYPVILGESVPIKNLESESVHVDFVSSHLELEILVENRITASFHNS